MRKLLLLPLIVVGVVLTLPFVIWQQFRMTRFARNWRKRHRKPPAPLTDADLAKVEKQQGFALPADLRQFYLSGRHRRASSCGEYYSLKGLVDEYRMLTRKPYGPNGEDWPANLLPFENQLESYAAYDLETGLVTIWDSEEIAGGNESRAAWTRSFQPTGKTLAEYLAR
ncbi:MAG TPA: SMI1/KNR4 family protein [Sphingomicrobium sp.]|nr:SMI1/KNR4 family protein [Sphingomicrobium sp.]